MSKNKKIPRTLKCIRDLPFVFLLRPDDPRSGDIRIVMIEISEEDEHKLDSGIILSVERGGLLFTIDPVNCLGYGKLDLSPTGKDLETIANSDWDSKLNITQFMRSDYDYETHTITTNTKHGKWYDTTNSETYLPYLYACMNKPERVCIFKEKYNSKQILRAKRKAERDRNWARNNKDKIRARKHKNQEKARKAKLSLLTFGKRN